MPYWHQRLTPPQPLIHRPVADKLVGVVAIGTWTESGTPVTHEVCLATIRITNPNCDIPIKLTQLSIIRDDGIVTYEGPFLSTPSNSGAKITLEQLLPHCSSACQLRYCMPITLVTATTKTDYGFPDPNQTATGTTHWLTALQAVQARIRQYTVEIEWWAAAQEAHPPIAFLQQLNVHTDAAGQPQWSSMSSEPMVILKHYKD
jgi:hypothetical protein